jgi:hypothetical protein
VQKIKKLMISFIRHPIVIPPVDSNAITLRYANVYASPLHYFCVTSNNAFAISPYHNELSVYLKKYIQRSSGNMLGVNRECGIEKENIRSTKTVRKLYCLLPPNIAESELWVISGLYPLSYFKLNHSPYVCTVMYSATYCCKIDKVSNKMILISILDYSIIFS